MDVTSDWLSSVNKGIVMLSVSSVFEQIHNNDEAFSLFVSVAEKGESQGGWENARIAELTRDKVLRPKIQKHGEDERRHGKLFASLLKRRGLKLVPIPKAADYCMQLENRGIGLSHSRLQSNQPLGGDEILIYLAHSRITEQRASEEVDLMVSVFGKHPDLGPPLRMIAKDEVNHLSYCHEELIRLRESGQVPHLQAMLKSYAQAEIEVYRTVSLDFVERMGRLLGWGRGKRAAMRLGVGLKFYYEKWFAWRRMVKLESPAIKDAMTPRIGLDFS